MHILRHWTAFIIQFSMHLEIRALDVLSAAQLLTRGDSSQYNSSITSTEPKIQSEQSFISVF
jgi:hypothetical protein